MKRLRIGLTLLTFGSGLLVGCQQEKMVLESSLDTAPPPVETLGFTEQLDTGTSSNTSQEPISAPSTTVGSSSSGSSATQTSGSTTLSRNVPSTTSISVSKKSEQNFVSSLADPTTSSSSEPEKSDTAPSTTVIPSTSGSFKTSSSTTQSSRKQSTTTTVGSTTTTQKVEQPTQQKPVVNRTPICGAYWGAYVNSSQRTGGYDASHKLEAIRYVEGEMGRTFDFDHQFYRWDDFVTSYNIENYIRPSIADGRTPFLSWKPVYKDNTNIAWTSIASGEHDVLIREKARQVKSIGSPIALVFGHEADSRVGAFQPGKTESGHVKTDAGSAEEFAAAYRHVHDIFAEEGASNVSWAWIMTRAPFEPNAGNRAANLLYPGDAYVDIVGLDPYNFFHNGNWREMSTLMEGFTNWVDQNDVTQPWMLAEWGSVEDPNQQGRKAEWLRNAADYFESESRISYLVHFDSYPIYNWRFDSSASSAAAWKEISNRPYFMQNC